MNIKEEGKYYASMVRKFRTEYKSKNLQGFCRDQKVSYNKIGFVSPVRRYEALVSCTAAANVILVIMGKEH